MGAKNCIPGKSTTAQLAPGLHLMQAVTVSGTSTVSSAVFNASNLDNVGLDITFSGTMNGTLTVNCSCSGVAGTFKSLTFQPALTQPIGINLAYLINLNQLPFPYIQISYTNASGSGTLDVYLGAKDLN